MICIGHRGARGHEPENTIRSVERAIELGASWVEVDVQVAEDRLVVIHDTRLERTTNGRGYVAEQTFTDLRSLDAGRGERIPTLAEVFDAVDGRVGINVELKAPGTAPLVVDLLRSRGAGTEVLVSSFDHRELERVRGLDPAIPTGASIVGIPVSHAAFAEALGARTVHPSTEFLDQAFVDDAHARGLEVLAFTANHPDEIARMRALGIDGVFTDYPERV